MGYYTNERILNKILRDLKEGNYISNHRIKNLVEEIRWYENVVRLYIEKDGIPMWTTSEGE